MLGGSLMAILERLLRTTKYPGTKEKSISRPCVIGGVQKKRRAKNRAFKKRISELEGEATRRHECDSAPEL